MKYKDPDTGEFKTLRIKGIDNLPVGTELDISDDSEIPDGWEEISTVDESVVSPTEPTGNNRKKIWIRSGKNLYLTYGGNDIENKAQYGLDLSSVSAGYMYADTTRVCSCYFIEVKPNTTYTISWANTVACSCNMYEYSLLKLFIKQQSIGSSGTTFTTGASTYYIKFWWYNTADMSAAINTSTIYNIQLELGSTATTYESPVNPAILVLNDNNVYQIVNETALELDTGWTKMSFASGWRTHGTSFTQGSFRRINSKVYLQGLVQAASSSSSGTICVLPSWCVPKYHHLFGCVWNGSSNTGIARVDVHTDGNLVHYMNDSSAKYMPIGWLSLEGISYDLGPSA